MTEHEAAQAFRKSLGLTLSQMAELTGYTRQHVHHMERGRGARGDPIPPFAWQRYKMCCLAVAILKKYDIADISRWQWK